MSSLLIKYYVTGIENGWFMPPSNTGSEFPDELETKMVTLEKELQRFRGVYRKENPEWEAAQQLLKSPLMKALK